MIVEASVRSGTQGPKGDSLVNGMEDEQGMKGIKGKMGLNGDNGKLQNGVSMVSKRLTGGYQTGSLSNSFWSP